MLLIKLIINICWSIFAQDATCHLIIMSFAESSFHTTADVTQLLMYCNLILGPVTSWRVILCHLSPFSNDELMAYSKSLENFKYGLPYGSHHLLLCIDPHLDLTRHFSLPILSSWPLSSHHLFHLFHWLCLLGCMLIFSWIVFLDSHVLELYSQHLNKWSTSMCDSWKQDVQVYHMSSI